MKIACISITLLLVLIRPALANQDDMSKYDIPDTSNPAVAAFLAWHKAIVNEDFDTYRNLTPALPNITSDSLKRMFDQLRSTAPNTVKITDPKINQRGSVEFHAIGCRENQPVVGIFSVRLIEQSWNVGGVWGSSWNPKISEIVKCP